MGNLDSVRLSFQVRHSNARNVQRNPKQSDRLTARGKFDEALRGNPTHSSIGQHHSVFRLVAAIAFVGLRQRAAHYFAIIWVQSLEKVVEIKSLRLRKTELRAPLVDGLKFVACVIPKPK